MNRQKLIGADTEASVAEFLSQLAELPNLFFQAVNKDEIVPAALHLGERNLYHSLTYN